MFLLKKPHVEARLLSGEAVLMSGCAKSAGTCPFIITLFRIVVPGTSAPVVDFVTEGSKFIHDSILTAVVSKLAFDIGEAV